MSKFVEKYNVMRASVSVLREKLHEYIDHVEDKKVKAFYTIVQTDIEEELVYTDELRATLDGRYDAYKAGKTKMIPSGESKKKTQTLLKNTFKK